MIYNSHPFLVDPTRSFLSQQATNTLAEAVGWHAERAALTLLRPNLGARSSVRKQQQQQQQQHAFIR